MSDQKPFQPDSTIDRAKHFDAICDQFEAKYSAGNRPSIESFLVRVDGPDKQPLLVELIAIEMHYRRQNGESIEFSEYQTRFPGLSASRLEETIQHAEQGHSPKTPAADEPTIDSRGIAFVESESKLVKYFGDYELLDVIARGGMGIVYKARQVSLNRIVALKMILSGEFASKEEVDRFYSEAKAAALLDHPGIVPIYEVGEHEGKHFFSMTYVDGSSLAAKLNDGPLEPVQAASTMLEVSQAVHYAHQLGVIHRDLKPSNILLDMQGRPRVTDFGLAKRLSEDTGMTVSGQVLGTPSYMPPEQAAGHINTIGPASDVYGLGAVLYSLATGRPPFQAASKIDTLRQVVEKEPVAPRQLNSAIPRDLETIILKCLEKSLPRRYGTAKELSDELQRFIEGRPITARPIGRVAKVWRWCRRQPMVASLLAAVFLSLILGIGVSSYYAIKESKERKEQERQKNIANEARAEKERQAEIAEQERDRAKASESKTRRNLYVSDAARVEELVKESNLVRAKTLLERHIPKSTDEEDLRGFDWYYHWRQVSQQKARFDFKKPVEVIDLSADEKTLAVGCEGGRAYLLDIESGKVQDTTFSIDDEHWSSIAFVKSDRLIGHGQQGGFKLWDQRTSETLAAKPSLYASNSKKKGEAFEDRIPASVSKDGMRMVCSDITNNLALWDLTSMRPQPIPYVNDGIHVHKRQGKVVSQLFMLNREKLLAPYVRQDDKLLKVTGSRDWDEFFTRWYADIASTTYSPAGHAKQLLVFEKSDFAIGHPITAISFSIDGKHILTGNLLGEIQLWTTDVLEDPSRWTEVLPQSRSLGKLPIRSVNLAPARFAVCDEKQCWVYGVSDLTPILKIDAKDTSFSVARFVGNDLVAVGTSSGLVDLWRVSDSKLLKRFFTGQGEIREILTDKAQKSLYVASSEGCVASFELEQNPSPLVPQRLSYSAQNASVTWLPLSKRIVFHRDESDEFVLVDPSNPEQPTALDLKVPGVLRRIPSVLKPLLFRERKNGTEIVSIHEQEINVWNWESMSLVNKLDPFQHVDDNGRIHPIAYNRHPVKFFYFNEGVYTEQPILNRMAFGSFGVASADLFSDERRLAMVIAGTGLQLILRDLDTGKVLSELRISGASAQSYPTTLTCLDERRVFVNGVGLLTGKTLVNSGLVWNTSDNSFTVVDTSLKSNAATTPTSVIRGQQHVMNQANERKEIGIWDRTEIRILDSNSLLPIVEAVPPEKGKIEFAHLDSNGELHAVLSVLDLSPDDFGWASRDLKQFQSFLRDFRAEEFRWSRWNRDSKEWQTEFSWKEKKREHSPDMRWSFDPAQSVLYYLQQMYSGSFQRWSTKDGIELPALQIPFGSVESFQLNECGTGIALLKSKVQRNNSPWSNTWYDKDIRFKSGPFKFSLPLEFVSKERNAHIANSYLSWCGANVRLEGKELEMGKPNSLELWSENHSCLVQFVDGTLHYWLLGEELDGKSKFVFRYAGSSQVSSEDAVVKASLSPDGSRIAIASGSGLRWSTQPFQEWQTVQLNAPSDAKITSIRWSWDNKTVAVGFSNGDVILHDVEIGSSSTLARGHLDAIHDSLWLPDRRSIATAGNDGNIVFWDIAQLELRMRIEAHRGAVKTLAYDPAKSTLYSGGEDGLIRRWVAASNSTEPQSPNRFVTPDPNSPLNESIAAPSTLVIRNRGVAQWLKSLNVGYGIASFGMPLQPSYEMGMPLPLNYQEDELDAMSVLSISFRSFPNVVDEDLARLSDLPELRSLDLSNCKISASGIGKLKRLVGLHTLNLSGIDLSGFDFESLKDSANLRTLTLNRCSISDDQFHSIMRLFPLLSALEVSVSRLTDNSVSKIHSLKNLKTLNLESSKITDESLSAIKTLKMLEQLDLSDTKVSGDNLSQLESLTLLTKLRIKGVPARDDWLNSLAASKLVAWENMKFLDIRDTAITSIGVKAFIGRRKSVDTYVSPRLFGEYPEIEALLQLGPLRGTIQVDGKPLDVLKAIAALKSGGSITGLTWPIDKERSEEDLEVLARLPKLERIEISADASLKTHLPILPRIKGLRELDFSAATAFRVGDIQQLRRLKLGNLYSNELLAQLQELNDLESLEYTTGVGIDVVAKALPNLKSLSCPSQNAKALTEAIPFLQSLEALTIPQPSPTDKDFGPNLAKLKNLKRLIIHYPYYVPNATVKKLQATLPGITVEGIKK